MDRDNRAKMCGHGRLVPLYRAELYRLEATSPIRDDLDDSVKMRAFQ